MRELVTIDMRHLYEKRKSEPNKQNSGKRLILTNEQEWYLWTLKDHCSYKQLASDLGIGRDKVSEFIKQLTESDGPKGEKPEWM